MEKELKGYTQKDLINMQTFENGLILMEDIGRAIVQMPHTKPISVVSNLTGEVEELSPTFTQTIEGLTEKAAEQLCLAGHQDIVEEIIDRHREQHEDDPDVEIVLFGDEYGKTDTE